MYYLFSETRINVVMVIYKSPAPVKLALTKTKAELFLQLLWLISWCISLFFSREVQLNLGQLRLLPSWSEMSQKKVPGGPGVFANYTPAFTTAEWLSNFVIETVGQI